MAFFLTSVKSNATTGEKRFAKLLEVYLDDSYLVWFDLPTNSEIPRFPDFLIFNPKNGLWCIEIKDWHFGNLKGATKEIVKMKKGDGFENRTHPSIQARDSLLPVLNKLQKDKSLIQPTGKYQGKLAIPWGYGAVMSNWKKSSINNQKEDIKERIYQCFPENQIFFKEEISEDDGIISKEEFIKKLHALLPYQFGNGLNEEQTKRVRACIFPEFVIEQYYNLFDEEEKEQSFPNVIKIMDNKQEKLARNLGDGHRVIHGVAGSGKTLILEHRAKQLVEQDKNKKVLVLCYNVLLASKLKGRLTNDNIEILHFHGWLTHLRKKFNIKTPNEDKNKSYQENLKIFETIIIEAINNGEISNEIYDAILIDEGHDFASDWLSAIVKMVSSDNDNLFLLYDDAQSIYDNRQGIGFTLSSVGINARGRTTILRKNYRNTKEILAISDSFIHQFLTGNDDVDEEDIPFLSPTPGGVDSGKTPNFQLLTKQNDEFECIFNKLNQWKEEGINLREIAILYSNNYYADKLNTYLKSKGITTALIKNKADKENYLPKSSIVTLCTMHSSKGSEFSHVILADLGGCRVQEPEITARLIYVGMTRAMNELFMTSSSSNIFTKEILNLLDS